jgi:putative CocE/NonD family hydrolase
MKPSVQAVLAGVVLLHLAQAQPALTARQKEQLEYTRAHYTKYEFRIPMRDGIKLFTAVYVPKDLSQQYPMLLLRTPYSVEPYGTDNYRRNIGPSAAAEKEGFIFAYQDVRGRYMSEGTFIDVPPHKTNLNGKETDESTDTYDTVDWLIKNIPNNNGRIGMWGISYPGFFAAYGLMNSHPALKAVSPQAPMGDVGNGDDAYHNGAFQLAANFEFYTFFKARGPEPERPSNAPSSFDDGTPDAYEFFLGMGPLANANERFLKNQSLYWNDVLKHPAYDEFWQTRAQAPHMKNVTPATLFVGGWFDAEDLAGPLKLFRAVEKNGPKAPNTLVMGPWCHGCWARMDGRKLGALDFASDTSEFFQQHIELPFFLQNLKSKGDGLKTPPDNEIPKAWVFETGTNQWLRFAAWPPKDAIQKSLYLGRNGMLSFSTPSTQGTDEYVSDPAKPVPILAGIGDGMPRDYMTYDQRFASRRPDVLVYQTEPLEADVTIAGPITPRLKVSTSGTDSDFIVKLIDVYPNDYPNPDPNPAKLQMPGYQQLVRGEPFRGKYRNSFSKPAPFTPGKPARIEFNMPDVCHTFRSGHRIMVQIQSTWFPLVDRNPQQFENIPTAEAHDFVKATERIYHGGEDGSLLRVFLLQ